MTYTDEYKKKLISLEEAVGKIHSDDKVVVAMAAAQPPGLLSTLHTIKDKVRRVKVIACLLLKDYEFLHDVGKGDDTPFLLEDWYFGGPEKDLYKKGLATFIPNNLHSAGTEKLWREAMTLAAAQARRASDSLPAPPIQPCLRMMSSKRARNASNPSPSSIAA